MSRHIYSTGTLIVKLSYWRVRTHLENNISELSLKVSHQYWRAVTQWLFPPRIALTHLTSVSLIHQWAKLQLPISPGQTDRALFFYLFKVVANLQIYCCSVNYEHLMRQSFNFLVFRALPAEITIFHSNNIFWFWPRCVPVRYAHPLHFSSTHSLYCKERT